MRNAWKHKAILLSDCAALVFKRIENVVGADRLNANSYSEIVQKMKLYTMTCHLYSLCSDIDSTPESALLELTEQCAYGDSLSDMLRDRL